MSNFDLENKIRGTIWGYLDEESDGEFLRNYKLNPNCLEPLVEDLVEIVLGWGKP